MEKKQQRCRVLASSERGVHIIGKCWHCDEEHSGLLRLAISMNKKHGPIVEIGVAVDDFFHPIETVSLKDLFDAASEDYQA